LVLVGCAIGASAGTSVRFPGLGVAVFSPPYAIVTAVLWRTDPRRWWIILLAASAGSFVPQQLGGASVTLFLLSELVNHLRAVLAAIGLRRFAGRSGRLTSMREMVGYLGCAVFAAPCVAALAGAGGGVDAPEAEARAVRRAEARRWLRADLASCSALAEAGGAAEREELRQRLEHWLRDEDLAGLREASALEALPAAEGADCAALWEEVGALLSRATDGG